MGIKEDISSGIVTALKKGDKLRLSTLRFLLAAINNREKEKREPLTDDEVRQVAATMAKQRRDSIEQFRNGGRMDLVEKEEKELEIVNSFLPARLSPEDIDEAVRRTAAEIGASTMKDMGALMKAVMERLKGAADGKAVQECVKRLLAG